MLQLKEKEISVIMGVYNCALTLRESIDSVLAQTYSNWELIICDDYSTDETVNIAQLYCERYPEKIRLIRNSKNMGLSYSLNCCLKYARGEYIARQDGDDVSLSERFEKEATVLKENPHISIVSCRMLYFDKNGICGTSTPTKHPTAKDFLYGTPFCHAPCMVRREAFEAVGGYSTLYKHVRVEDYHLWIKMFALGYRGVNIQEALYMMRDDSNAFARRKFRYRINESRLICEVIEEFSLSKTNYIYALRPLIVGILPKVLYTKLHKRRLNWGAEK